MRGLALRVWRGLLAMDVISRLARMTPEAKIETLQKLIQEKKREIENLEEEIAELELQIKPPKQSEAAKNLREGEAA
ncbi:hypothetical protein C5Y96_13950 [Blastopirellula marina]|uniref:Uncharacterized protein n=2 Tax=Pirellulales TaxID=2691354 RepID=A0A2S8FEH9_9BACT|nr:hypothetical protein C5Y96_13950 [Blastopirellula marina]RCS50706.1 hypothetical protein DTL36_13960 [Bremerella cremea]